MTDRVYLGLGGNLDEPLPRVRRVLTELNGLPDTRLTGQSPFYRSRAVGPGDQPDYINAVARLETSLEPLVLLDLLQGLEQRHGRRRERRWGPRTLDLDILLWADRRIDHPRLQVPHPEMTRRNFVLYPLADLDPDLTLPNGVSLGSLLAGCPPDHLAMC